MAVNGARFLKLSSAERLAVTRHALDRIQEHAGRCLSEEQACEVFCAGRQVTALQALLLGYRPAYGRRMNQGQKSWYFRLQLDGRELIAVVTEGDYPDEFVWVTTYAPNRQTEQYRMATPAMLGFAA